MKNLNLISLLLITVLVFSSCSVEDDLILDEPTLLSPKDIFEKQPTVQRNVNGSYFIDYKLKKGVDSDVITNQEANTKNINLYSSNNQVQRSFNEDLLLGGKGEFTVAINNTETDNKSTITILDDDIKFSRNVRKDHLKKYKITDNGDGTYTLDFTIKDNIKVDFIQNEDAGKYEVHLDRGDSDVRDFSRTFTKERGEDLKISFINYHYDNTGRTFYGSLRKSSKPKVVVTD